MPGAAARRQVTPALRKRAVELMRARMTTLPLLLVAGTLAGAAESPLPFIEDDYPRALAQARQRGVPIFVDTWATW